MYYIGIDMGGTNTKIGVLDEKNNLLKSISFKTNSYLGMEKTIENISNNIKELLKDLNIKLSDLKSVGVGVPGPVLENSIVRFWANFSWPENSNLKDEFQKHFLVPVFVDNDVNVIALGENLKGASKGYKDVVTIAIGTGIGAGIIINSKPISGKNGSAGEVGHIKIERSNTKNCGCGQEGCLEAYSSATGIVREALSRISVSKDTKLKKIYEEKKEIEAKDIFDLAKENDEFCVKIVNQYMDNLAFGISNILNILDPEIIVIAGGISLAGDYVLKILKEKLKIYTMKTIYDNLNLKTAILGNDAGVYGACYLAMLYTNR